DILGRKGEWEALNDRQAARIAGGERGIKKCAASHEKKSIRNVANLLELSEILQGCVEDPVASTNACLARAARQFREEARIPAGRIGKAEPGTKVIVLRGGESRGNSGVARNHPSRGSSRKQDGLHAGNERFDFALGVIPGLNNFIAQAVVEGEIRRNSPTILSINAGVLGTGIEELLGGLNEGRGGADQEIGKVAAGFTPAKDEIAVLAEQVSIVDLVIVEIGAKFQTVPAKDLREVVLPLESIVELVGRIGGNA